MTVADEARYRAIRSDHRCWLIGTLDSDAIPLAGNEADVLKRVLDCISTDGSTVQRRGRRQILRS